jgi:hypothetical protein
LSPILADLKQQQAESEPFKVPNLYFYALADAVELREVSPFLADLKAKQAETEPFRLPKFYFEQLTDTVLAKATSVDQKTIAEKSKGTPEEKSGQAPQYFGLSARLNGFLATIFQPKLALAFASLVLVATAGWYALTHQSATTTVVGTPQTAVIETPKLEQTLPTNGIQVIDNQEFTTLSNIPKTDIQDYINDNLNDFDEALLIEHAPQLADISIEKKATEAIELTHPKSGLTEEELELYLKEHGEEADNDGSDNNL